LAKIRVSDKSQHLIFLKMVGKFISDIFSTFVAQILVFLFGLFVSVIIARQLGPEGKGLYSLVVFLPSFLVYFTSLSIGQSAIYYIGKKKYLPVEIYGSTVILGFLISLFCFAFGGLALLLHNIAFPGVALRYLVFSLFLAPCQLFFGYLGYLLLGFQEIKRYNFFSFLQAFLFFLAVLTLFALSSINIINLIMVEVSAYIAVLFLILSAVIRKTGSVKLIFNSSYAKDAIVFGSKIYASNVLSFVNYRLNILLINFFLNPVQVGLWSVATAISEKLYFFSDAIGTVLFPKAASNSDSSNVNAFIPVVFRSVMLITFIFVLALFFAGNLVINILYSDKFATATKPFQILLVGAFSLAGFKVLESDFKGRGKPELVTIIIGISAFINVTLSLLLIPERGIVGAAWASTISYVVAMAIGMLFYVRASGNSLKDMILIKRSDIDIYFNFARMLAKKIFNK